MLSETTAIRENGATSGIGVLATYTYDDLGRRTSITRADGTTTSYGYDLVSRLTSLAHDFGGSSYDQTIGLAYSPAAQIASRTSSNDAYSFPRSNMDVTESPNGLNQLAVQGTTPLTYDGRGNLTGFGGGAYTCGQRNQMATAGSYHFYYDPPGRLAVIHNGTTGPTFDYDGSNLVGMGIYGGAMINRRYVHGPGTDQALVWYEGSGTTDRRWLYQDERGSVIAVANDSGSNLFDGIQSHAAR